MRAFVALVLFLAAPLPLLAEPISFSWTRPTTYVDGAALAPADIEAYEIDCVAFTPKGGVSGPCTLPKQTAAGTALSFTFDAALVPGEYCFRAKTRTVAAKGGLLSEYSSRTCKTKEAPNVPPVPPANFQVVDSTAYDVVPDFQKFALVRGKTVGTVPLGTACDRERTVGEDYRVVTGVKVRWFAFPRSSVYVARCA